MSVDLVRLVKLAALGAQKSGGRKMYTYEKAVEILTEKLVDSTFVDPQLLIDNEGAKTSETMIKHAKYLADAFFDHDDGTPPIAFTSPDHIGIGVQPQEEKEMKFAENDMIFAVMNGMIVRGTIIETNDGAIGQQDTHDVMVQISHDLTTIRLNYVKEDRLAHTMEDAYEIFQEL